jgi:ribose transport system substrate-binding protein
MMRRLLVMMLIAFSLLGVSVRTASAQDAALKVAVVTPYLAQPGTQYMVEAFEAYGKEKGWTVSVEDTAGDVAGAISAMETIAAEGADAVVINVDPAQVEAGLTALQAANIPVFGMDAGTHPMLVTNVTSNGYAMAAETATYVVDRIGGKGNVVMFVFDPYPPVQKRGIIADALFANNPDIKVLDRVTPNVDDGGIADSRARMEAILAANPDAGSISAVWAAWDQPALGALQAIEAAGRQGEGIVIVGIDANPQALDAIAAGGNFEASVAQDFGGIGSTVGSLVERYVGGDTLGQSVVYVPTTLVTKSNVAEFLPK